MKKTLLLLTAAAFAANVNAQEKAVSIYTNPVQSDVNLEAFKAARAERFGASYTAAKKTASPRWYSYVDYFDQNEAATSSSIAVSAPYLWKDTMAVMAYSGTSGTEWQHNRSVSLGLTTDPAYSGFNDASYYYGETQVTSGDAYTVDSIRFFGRYGYNPTKTGVTDTLRVVFAYGAGMTSTDDVYLGRTTNPAVLTRYGLAATDTMNTYRLHFDTVTTRATGVNVVVKDIILDNSGASPAWGDTLSDGTYVGQVQVSSSGISIPAGNLLGASVTFISGDASFTAHDTVFGSSVGFKYNMFRPFVAFRGTSATPAWATYSADDRNNGVFKTLPDTANGWGGQYIPLWFWSASGGTASTLQYPWIEFRVSACATCGIVGDPGGVNSVTTINKASAYPNPANDEITVPFNLNKDADVLVTLNDMTGRAVASMQYSKVSNGKAVFSTAKLPAGLYMYTVSADGQKMTGRISVVH